MAHSYKKGHWSNKTNVRRYLRTVANIMSGHTSHVYASGIGWRYSKKSINRIHRWNRNGKVNIPIWMESPRGRIRHGFRLTQSGTRKPVRHLPRFEDDPPARFGKNNSGALLKKDLQEMWDEFWADVEEMREYWSHEDLAEMYCTDEDLVESFGQDAWRRN